ncbi:hypothetical protein CMO94_01465 [Candidatus Woesearchaeota archaeon]|jgi:hypothetical protein|nr:hypothetical protein [Candidatus Woesearchaeota archaeon]
MPENEDIEELKKELKKLKPKDRLKKLKELGEKRKAEMVDIDQLIKDSEKDLKTEAVAEEIAPRQDEINITRLFEEEAGKLESTVKKEAPETEKADQGYFSFKQAYNDYSNLQDIAYAGMAGNLTSAQEDAVDKIGERLDKTKYQSASQETANILVASKAVLYKIKKYAGLE